MVSAVSPSELNKYACQLEDTLEAYGKQLGATQQFAQYQDSVLQQLKPHIDRYKAMETLLTEPSLLAAYTKDFFTHVHPVQSERDKQEMAVSRASFPDMPPAQGNRSSINLSDVRPDQRWMVADDMERHGMFANKVLVME